MLTVVVAFTQFGFWQLRRHAQRVAANEVAAERLAAAAVPLDAALAEAAAAVAGGAAPDAALRDRRATASGTFEPADELLRRPVSRDGRPGYHVVTPLRLDDGRRLWVERGWVSDDVREVPVVRAPAPTGRVTVVGWLRPTSRPPDGWAAALSPRDPPTGRLVTVAYLDPERLAAQVGGPLVDAVLWLEGWTPADDGEVGTSAAGTSAAGTSAAGDPLAPAAAGLLPIEAPTLGAGPHLGYALQWFSFAAIAAVGYLALLRRVLREARELSRAPG